MKCERCQLDVRRLKRWPDQLKDLLTCDRCIGQLRVEEILGWSALSTVERAAAIQEACADDPEPEKRATLLCFRCHKRVIDECECPWPPLAELPPATQEEGAQ